MKKTMIVADSTCDLGAELIARYGVRIVPLDVLLGGKTHLDGVEITPDDIYRHYKEKGELPRTAAPNMTAFSDTFTACLAEAEGVVCFTISAEMSSTHNNARMAALEHENVYAVDTRNLSTGGGLVVLAAAEMAEQGMDAAAIADACRALVDRVNASFIVDDLEFLHKGGRCSALAALGANLLQLKPCITVQGGKMGVSKKYRGKFCAVLEKYAEERIGDGTGIVTDHVFVTHAGCDAEIVETIVAKVKALLPDANVHITRAGCTVSAHCGKNTLGVLFLRKEEAV